MNDDDARRMLPEFLAHSQQLAREAGIELDFEDTKLLLERSNAGGFTPEATVRAFAEIYPPSDDGRFEFEGDEDIDWDDDDEPERPDFSKMTREETNDWMVARARELEEPEEDDPDREYDLSNHKDFVDYATLRIEGGFDADDFDDRVVEAPGEAA